MDSDYGYDYGYDDGGGHDYDYSGGDGGYESYSGYGNTDYDQDYGDHVAGDVMYDTEQPGGDDEEYVEHGEEYVEPSGEGRVEYGEEEHVEYSGDERAEYSGEEHAEYSEEEYVEHSGEEYVDDDASGDDDNETGETSQEESEGEDGESDVDDDDENDWKGKTRILYSSSSAPWSPCSVYIESSSTSIEPTSEQVWNVMKEILNSKPAYKLLLDSKEKKAQTALDIMQKVLDNENTPEDLRPAALTALKRLCLASGAYPQCLTLQDIQYERDPIASGSFGDIYIGNYNNQQICLKIARVYRGKDINNIIKGYTGEAIVWGQISHPNLLPFYGIYRLQVSSRGSVALISPWMPNGNINDYLEANPEVPRIPLIHEVLAGLTYLHNHSIVHGDIKGANILISQTGSACLADFGLSSVVDADVLRWTSQKTMTRPAGTLRWAAPEFMDDSEDATPATFTTDIYSMASMIYEVLTGRIPFYEIPRDETVISRVIKGIRPSKPAAGMELELTDEIWEIMNRCWNPTPSERPTASQVADGMQAIPPNALTIKRTAQHQKVQQTAEGQIFTSRSFRTEIRGQGTRFSEAEFNVLREYVVPNEGEASTNSTQNREVDASTGSG
ncbi:kinase-like protein [Macrolepiota fuliginosa MF-IS2]|uniref:Kinase-like protein n=1 Tax=Macrolepiota fuliginosa MF-IS2 TaxID=1400762 RepID=A0A9P5XEF2_9AGAR|nr:kinase-like protein [Macrolepiota fuliginosa MF-IS2]